MSKGVFYHAASPVCLNPREHLRGIHEKSKHEMLVLSIGEERARITGKESVDGTESVPAVIQDADDLHINFSAKIEDL